MMMCSGYTCSKRECDGSCSSETGAFNARDDSPRVTVSLTLAELAEVSTLLDYGLAEWGSQAPSYLERCQKMWDGIYRDAAKIIHAPTKIGRVEVER